MKQKTSSEVKAKSASRLREPQTMEALLAAYGQGIKGFTRGQKVKGRVIAKFPKSLVLDIGGKSEGIVAEKAFIEARDYIRNLKIGDEVLANVIIPEGKNGETLLSLREASSLSLWNRLEDALKTQKTLFVIVRSVNPSGVSVECEGVFGFIPLSHLGKSAVKNIQFLLGKNLQVKILEISRTQNKVVFSERAVSEEGDIKLGKEAFKKLKPGDVFDGEVTSVADFGCFVKINLGTAGEKEETFVEGLVHISEISWGKVVNIKEVIAKGDIVKVKVIGKTDGKLSLSIKQAESDPWEKVQEKYKQESRVRGKVTKISDFGVFVELEPGIEGLIHMTKIPPGKKLTFGQEVDCYVEEISSESKKLALGLVLTEKPIGYK